VTGPATAPLAERLRSQAAQCRTAGSHLTGDLLDGAADDLAAGGPTADLLNPLADDPPGSVPALRFAGAMHRLVLERRAPRLAVHYPSVGGSLGDLWPAARQVVAEQLAELRPLVRRPVQTNEIGRSSALLGGLLHAVQDSALPVRLLEIGASGGLNLHVDRYRHEVAPDLVLGDPASDVRLDAPWQGRRPPIVPLRIAERTGCDLSPLDPASAEDRLTLTSYVWADQLHRFERLRAALCVAAAHPVPVEGLTASAFLARELLPQQGVCTVVWHSVVRQYFTPDERKRVATLLADAGAQATADAPVAHLFLEPDKLGAAGFVVVLTMWPGGDRRVLADCDGHGPPIGWR